jgi:hypothetical protein
MDLGEIGQGGTAWIDLAQNRDEWRALVNMVMNHRVPQNVGKFVVCLSNWRLLKKYNVDLVS